LEFGMPILEEDDPSHKKILAIMFNINTTQFFMAYQWKLIVYTIA
jgi:hypothetical protein